MPADAVALHRLQRPVRRGTTVAAALQGTAAVLAIAPVVALTEIGRRLLADPGAAVWPPAALAMAALATRLLLYALAGALSHLADADLAYALRRRLTGQLSALPLGWFAGGVTGRVRTVVQDDVAALHHAVAHERGDLAEAVAGPAVVVAYLAWVDWRLVLVTLALVVLAQAVRMRLRARSADPVGRIAAAGAELTAAVVEAVHGIAVFKTFAGERGLARFDAAATAYAEADAQAQEVFVRPRAVARATVAPATVLVVVCAAGTAFVAAGWTRPIDLVPFVLLGTGLFEQITPLYTVRDQRRRAMAAAGRIVGLLDEPRQPEVEPGSARTPARPPVVEVRDVHFGYPGGPEVLRGVSARLAPGTVTALVGASGAGKSTLAGLVARFYDVTAGAITVGGADLREIARDDLYRHVGFLLQDAALLHRTVRDNIALAVPDATEDAVHEAARAAGIHDRIRGLPRGYGSVVGDDAHLSGGEAQRVAIARTLLAGTPILILDEATAHADPDSEAAVQDALARLATGRTVLVIAHRLHTITHADQILVLHDGAVAERGRHPDLLAAGGRYARLWRIQYGDTA